MTTDGGRNEPERYLSTSLSLKNQWCIFNPELLCTAFIGEIMEKLPENFVMGPSVCEQCFCCQPWQMGDCNEWAVCVGCVCVCVCVCLKNSLWNS